jgi:hypothetical protein
VRAAAPCVEGRFAVVSFVRTYVYGFQIMGGKLLRLKGKTQLPCYYLEYIVTYLYELWKCYTYLE